MTQKEKFNLVFKEAIENKKGIIVDIESPDMPEAEIIINPFANVEAKTKYYNEAYDDNMCLKNNKNIKMINAYINLFF